MRREHITPVLKSLHWVPFNYRIHVTVLLPVYISLDGLGPEYISDMFKEYKLLDPWTLVEVPFACVYVKHIELPLRMNCAI